MILARRWESLDAVLAGAPNVWSAYQAAGVLPAPDDSKDSEKKDGPVKTPEVPPENKVAEYVAEFSKLQKMLRRIKDLREDMGAEVPAAEQKKINLVIDQIINFATKLRGEAA